MKKCWFLQVQLVAGWPVADPVAWCLENAHQPLLEPARDRLLVLDAQADPERIINAALRRCGLNLVEVGSLERVVIIHFWTALADPRPLFKEEQLARPEVRVAHLRRKNGAVIIQIGDNFLFGEQPWQGFQWGPYRRTGTGVPMMKPVIGPAPLEAPAHGLGCLNGGFRGQS
jgi:hypothetical protein